MARAIIDLTMDIYDGAPAFELDPNCSVQPYHTIESAGYNMTQISMGTHQGTHLDAPYHFLDDGKTVEQLDLSKCVGEAILVDLSHKRPKEAIDVADIAAYASRIQAGSRVIIRTDWHRQYPEKHYFSDFPYMTVELSQWLADQKIALIGMDFPTPNPTDYDEIHKILLRAEIVIVEGLANLSEIGEQPFMFVGAPLKIRGRDGSPIRAVAIIG